MTIGAQHLVPIAAALIVAGCASPQPLYGPQASPRGPGYAELKVQDNRYRISFTGTRTTPLQRVEAGLIYRAAELTAARGFSHFRLADQDVAEDTFYRARFSSFPYRGWYWHSWPGPVWGGAFATRDFEPRTRFTAHADVVMLTAAEAEGDPDAIEAAGAMRELGPIVRPPAGA